MLELDPLTNFGNQLNGGEQVQEELNKWGEKMIKIKPI